MKKSGIVILLILLGLSLQARFIKPKENEKKYNLKDGSSIKGILIGEDQDSLYVKNKIIGRVALPKKEIKFSGENLNNGTLISITPIQNEEKENQFPTTQMYTLGSAKIIDERFSTSIDIDYMYHDFTRRTTKYLEFSAGAEDEYCDVVDQDFQYKTHFFMPTFSLRFNFLPTKWMNSLTRNLHIYPYFSVGGGYSLGFVKYKFVGISSNGLSSDDYENKMHYYTGPIYRAAFGLGWRLSSHVALFFEGMYHQVTFEQRTNDKEDQSGMEHDKFIIEGFKPSFGIRFGNF